MLARAGTGAEELIEEEEEEKVEEEEEEEETGFVAGLGAATADTRLAGTLLAISLEEAEADFLGRRRLGSGGGGRRFGRHHHRGFDGGFSGNRVALLQPNAQHSQSSVAQILGTVFLHRAKVFNWREN